MTPDVPWAEVFADVFTQPPSNVAAGIWGRVLGAEYPAELTPYSYTTWSELQRFADELRVERGDQLLDIGCGWGGPGLWVAASTGASYLGVDVAETGLSELRDRAAGLDLAGDVRTAVGSFEQLPVESDSADGVMSIDALLFTPDKAAATVELARVLRPGGRLVLTTWDYSRRPLGRPEQVADHRPLLDDAGFEVEAYDTTPDWESRQRAIDRLLLAHVDELAQESGDDPQAVRQGVLEMAATVDAMVRRVLVVATRR